MAVQVRKQRHGNLSRPCHAFSERHSRVHSRFYVTERALAHGLRTFLNCIKDDVVRLLRVPVFRNGSGAAGGFGPRLRPLNAPPTLTQELIMKYGLNIPAPEANKIDRVPVLMSDVYRRQLMHPINGYIANLIEHLKAFPLLVALPAVEAQAAAQENPVVVAQQPSREPVDNAGSLTVQQVGQLTVQVVDGREGAAKRGAAG